jgi:fucose 4-O-acetylase-like acetyltransferase
MIHKHIVYEILMPYFVFVLFCFVLEFQITQKKNIDGQKTNDGTEDRQTDVQVGGRLT